MTGRYLVELRHVYIALNMFNSLEFGTFKEIIRAARACQARLTHDSTKRARLTHDSTKLP